MSHCMILDLCHTVRQLQILYITSQMASLLVQKNDKIMFPKDNQLLGIDIKQTDP